MHVATKAEIQAAMDTVILAGFVVLTPAEAARRAAPDLLPRPGDPLVPRDREWLTAIKKAEQLRLEHNGIGGVYLYLGHDGDNQCVLKDGSAKEVGKANSGRSMLEAIERAEKDWQSRKPLEAGDYVVPIMPAHGVRVKNTDGDTVVIQWDVRHDTNGMPGLATYEITLPAGVLKRVAA